MLQLIVGLLLIAGGAFRLLVLLGDAFMAAVDSDPRRDGWGVRPTLVALAIIVAGVLILIF